MVAYMDKLIGKVLGVLDEVKVREKTLVLFTGDNGTPRQISSKAGGKMIAGGKGTMADTGSHVPLIASWTGVSAEGKTCEDLINFTDFMPTFAEVSGAKGPGDRVMDGKSFLAQVRGEKGSPREWSLVELNERRFILSGKYKLQQNRNLFEVGEGVEEKLVPVEGQSKEAGEVRKKLMDILAEIPRGKKEAGNAGE
jgi:arylsulfatase A